MIRGLVNASLLLTPKQFIKVVLVVFWTLLLFLSAIVIVGVLNEAPTPETADTLQKGLFIFSIPPVITIMYFMKRILFK